MSISNAAPSEEANDSKTSEAKAVGRQCDFCGDIVNSVRRVALDEDYDRLQKAHREQYSCSDCFEKKEQDRIGMGHR